MKKNTFLVFCLLLASIVFGQAPTANFSAQSVSGCAPLVVSLQDLSTGGPTAWKWDFGNGNSSTLQNPSATYFLPGTYTVSLTATNSSGSNSITKTAYITVYDKPKVAFTADNTSGCFPLPVQFTDASVPSAGTSNVSWQWDFGNGEQANTQSPQYTFTASGQYTISLKVTNDKGCYASFTRPSYIRVPTGLSVSFDNTSVSRCQAPFPVTFNNTSTGPGTLSYVWDFGDGATSTQPSITHTYTAPGNYTVSLAVASTNGCQYTLRKPNLISIRNISTAFTAPDSICTRSLASFTNTSSPAPGSSQWDFGDGTTSNATSPTKVYPSAGTYQVRLFNNYGYCTDSFTKLLQALPLPTAAFTAPNTIQCKPPLTVDFKDASANAVSWFWDFGDSTSSTTQNPSHTFTRYGDYNVTLVVTNRFGCTDTLRKQMFVQIHKPVIAFPTLPQNGCVPYNAAFSAAVTTLDNITSYAWSFGDGSTSAAAAPTHTYPNQGNYTVSLTVTTSTGCTDSLTLPNAIVVGQKPIIDFTATPNPVCAFGNVSFTGITNEGDTWAWDFGDGSSSGLQNPLHGFTDTGRFTITLAVTNNGCQVKLSKPAYITVKPPIARFQFTKSCGRPKEFIFTDASVGAQSWTWDFGDGTKSNLQHPVHMYKDFGNYNVTLTVTNDTCSNSVTTTVAVFDVSPRFTADKRVACRVASIQFNAIVADPSHIASYAWNFSNGQPGNGANPQTTYDKAGDYTTTLITTDQYGCFDTVTQANHIRINGPTAGFTVSNGIGCRGLTALLTDHSTNDGQHPIAQWDWSYGDGQSGHFLQPAAFQHTYNDTGAFTLQLIVTDKIGCRDSLRLTDAVKTSAPKAAFVSNDTLTCLGSSVQLTNQTSATNYTSFWTFGDGANSTDSSPVHLYADTGAYTVSLLIKDQNGCADSLKKPAFIQIKKTTASFSVSDSIGGCVPYEVRFTNTSSFYASSSWQFGLSGSNVANPIYTYTLPGTYQVKLTVTGRGGCVDSAKKQIAIYNDSVTKFSYSPFDGCRPLLLHTNISSPANMTYSWDFGDGNLVTTKNKDTAHLYITAGSFLPRLIISDSGNCILPFTGADTVFVRGANVKFGVDRTLFCDSGTVHFTDSTTSNEKIVQYNWSFGDGSFSASQNPVHTYLGSGLYPVSLITTSSSLCRDTATLSTRIKIVQSPAISILGDSVLCQNEKLLNTGTYLRSDTSAVQWFWQFPNGNTSVLMLPPAQRYTLPGNFVISAVAVNSSGCIDSASKNIHVNPLPVITGPATLTSLVGTPIPIQPMTYSSNVVRYVWTPSTGLSCTTCPQPVARPNFNTLYTVTATDSNGCRNAATVQVIVLCKNANVFVPNTFSPNGDGSNDVFYVRGSGLARIKSLRIFNRLGEVVFEALNFSANDASKGWDGTYKGTKLSPDTYVYQLDVFCDNSDSIRVDGSLTLIR